MDSRFSIVWVNGPVRGKISLSEGTITGLNISTGTGTCDGDTFYSEGNGIVLEVTAAITSSAAWKAEIVAVETEKPFSFFLRDIQVRHPIYIPAYGVAVLAAEDQRSFEQIEQAVADQQLISDIERIEAEPEESFEHAAQSTRSLPCKTWLGLSRDIRIFEVGFRGIGAETIEERLWDWVRPRMHGMELTLPEYDNKPVCYRYMLGRGVGCIEGVTRRLDDGSLPILHADVTDNDVVYHTVSFVSNEKSALTQGTLKGTHYLVADGYGHGHMFTERQEGERKRILAEDRESEEETVLYFRATAVNRGRVPRYAWFKNVVPNAFVLNNDRTYTFDGSAGFVQFSEDRVCCVSKLDGQALTDEETAILLHPGESVDFEFYLPHRPISRFRAEELIRQNFDLRLDECRSFWKSKLSEGTSIQLPEKRLENMIKAGLLHLDLVAYGAEPKGTIVPTIGVYTAIGSESSPIVQFMDSMGWHSTAERMLQFFLDKQHDNGFIQNFGGYMLETGAALWSIGEHYRYTRDEDWVERIKPNLLKAFQYLAEWRERNKAEHLTGRGYGMLEGKTADPEDPFHSFMLSGYAYLGLSRLAEMLEYSDPIASHGIFAEAEALKADVRQGLSDAMARSPVVPLSDGRWVPSVPPWVEHRGPLALYAEGGKWLTHGSVVARDSLLGPLYLVLQEVVQPSEEVAEFMLRVHHELMCMRNVALSQPYYSIHPWIHLKRGEVKPFLQAYYNTVAALADRETYTFWEHFWHASPHKTHEEGWFLMQTRWMLYMENDNELRLLPGIPRAWLKDGEVIDVKGAATYFGPVSFRVESRTGTGRIDVTVVCNKERRPYRVKIRVPHPEGFTPLSVTEGRYSVKDESITIDEFNGSAKIIITYPTGGPS